MKTKMRLGMRVHARGFSMVELMISIAIGIVVVGAVLVSYVASGQTNRRQAAYAEMNENAQLAMSMMQRDLLLAGYAKAVGTDTVTIPGSTIFNRTYSGNAVFGCDGGFTTPNNSGGMTSAGCATGTTPAIEISYEADLDNSVPTSTNLPSDCLGNSLNAQTVTVGANTTTFYVTRNRYYLAIGTTGRSELHCASNRTPAVTGQPLVDNVENMKFWYGESAAAGSRQIVRYVSAAAGNTIAWPNVISVRICLLMRSAEQVLTVEDTNAGNAGYLDCNSQAQTSADRYVRRAYFSTTTLRNKMTL